MKNIGERNLGIWLHNQLNRQIEGRTYSLVRHQLCIQLYEQVQVGLSARNSARNSMIQVLVYEPGKPLGELREIDAESLEPLQEIVGGYIEALRVSYSALRLMRETGNEPTGPRLAEDRSVILVMNEEGLIHQLSYNRATLVGTFFVTGAADDGFASLTDEDISTVRAILDEQP